MEHLLRIVCFGHVMHLSIIMLLMEGYFPVHFGAVKMKLNKIVNLVFYLEILFFPYSCTPGGYCCFHNLKC